MKKSKQNQRTIPVHKLKERTDTGMEMHRFTDIEKADFSHLSAHRDDHYIFFLQETGQVEFVVDFKTLHVNGPAIFYVLPGQIHYPVSVSMATGMFLAMDTALVPDQYRTVFEEQILDHKPLQCTPEQCEQLKVCAGLLMDIYDQGNPSPINQSVLRSLSSVYIGIIAGFYQFLQPEESVKNSRRMIITRDFKKMLSRDYKLMKSPAEYASVLNISLSYLNESVKGVTGLPVSYWIQQEIVLEAKRLLYYSDYNIKEIAFKIGYEDHAYFSRLFTKSVGCSPIQFRKKYRE